MISAFGPEAERYAAGLRVESAVVAEANFLGNAYLEAVRRRETGEPFYGMLLYDDRRASVSVQSSQQILDQTADFDERSAALRHLADGNLLVDGVPAREAWARVPEMLARAGAEFYSLCDAVLVRSWMEHQRILNELKVVRPVTRVLVEPHLPDVRPRPDAQRLVVWAPHEADGTIALLALALTEFLGEVTFVWNGRGVRHFPKLRCVTPEDPQVPGLLAAAGVVITAALSDPGPAVAFARRGYGVVAPATSGASELVPFVVPVDIANVYALTQAIPKAFGRSAGDVIDVAPPPPVPALPDYPIPAAELPLVSIVIPTYNRRAELTSALEGLRRQTYPNIEIVVVNDGGEPVDDVVARHAPVARLINRETNGGVMLTTITGIEDARGAYVQLLADDDALYPDHLQRLMAAMLRHNAKAAHGNTLIRYLEPVDGGWVTAGFNASVFIRTSYPTEALISTAISGQALLVSTDVFREIGGYRRDTILADQEFQFRLWNRYPPVWVDNMTSEWRIRGKGGNISTTVDNSADEMVRIFNEMLPVHGRPMVDATRQTAINNVRARKPGETFTPTISITMT